MNAVFKSRDLKYGELHPIWSEIIAPPHTPKAKFANSNLAERTSSQQKVRRSFIISRGPKAMSASRANPDEGR